MSNGIFSGFDRGPANPDTITMDSFSSSGSSSSGGKKNKFRDALVAASKYKDQTDYKARKEAKEKAQTATMKISDDISVMEGYRDPGFTLEGQKGRSILGPVGAAVGVFNPGLGAGISAVGNLTGY